MQPRHKRHRLGVQTIPFLGDPSKTTERITTKIMNEDQYTFPGFTKNPRYAWTTSKDNLIITDYPYAAWEYLLRAEPGAYVCFKRTPGHSFFHELETDPEEIYEFLHALKGHPNAMKMHLFEIGNKMRADMPKVMHLLADIIPSSSLKHVSVTHFYTENPARRPPHEPDYDGPEFLEAYERLGKVGAKAGVYIGHGYESHTQYMPKIAKRSIDPDSPNILYRSGPSRDK